AGLLLAGMVLLGSYLFQLEQGPPDIAGNYRGPLYNTYANIHARMTLSLQQNQTSIHGYFSVGAPLSGNGSFTGSVDAKGHVEFLVRSKDTSAPLLFTGVIQ